MLSWASNVLHWKRRRAIGIALLAALSLVACSDAVEPVDPCPDDSFLNYENFGAPLMMTWCVPCHSTYLQAEDRQSATIGVNFDTYEGVVEQLDRIYVRAVESVEAGDSAMPPAGGTTEEDRALLREWLDCGAPL